MPHINIRGKNLFYEEKGEGFPVVFSHSYLWDSHMWQPQIEALSKKYRCIAIDLWEHGQSDHLPEAPYSIEACAEDYWELTQKIGLKEFAFLGLSVGGMIGAHLAVNYPQAIKALALVGTFLGEEPEKSKAQYEFLLNQFSISGQFNDELLNHVVPFFFSPVTLQSSPAFIENFRQSLKHAPANKMSGIVELGRAILLKRNSLLPRLPELSMPVLVMVGQDDIARPPHESKLMAENISGAHLEIIKDAGHICALEKPEEVTQQLVALLQRM